MDLNFFPLTLGSLFLMMLHYFTGMFLYHLWHPSFLNSATEWISIILSYWHITCCCRKRKIQVFSKYIVVGWNSLCFQRDSTWHICCFHSLKSILLFWFCWSFCWLESLHLSLQNCSPLLCAPGADQPVGTTSAAPSPYGHPFGLANGRSWQRLQGGRRGQDTPSGLFPSSCQVALVQ